MCSLGINHKSFQNFHGIRADFGLNLSFFPCPNSLSSPLRSQYPKTLKPCPKPPMIRRLRVDWWVVTSRQQSIMTEGTIYRSRTLSSKPI
ncbi:hypothetical protein LINPERHAP1_LOCUS25857 [Linum perenne]